MHELGITQGILSIALEKAGEANASRISQINLVIGAVSDITEDSIRLCFDLVSQDTIARGARLVFEKSPLRLRCPGCSAKFTPADFDWSCPECHEPATQVVSGRECHVQSIEVE